MAIVSVENLRKEINNLNYDWDAKIKD